MTLAMLLVLLLGLVLMAATFVAVAWKAPKAAKWLGLLVIAVAAPFFYWLGAFSEQFSSGICYSNTIQMIGDAVAHTDTPQELANQIRKLPLHGYETACADVEAAASQLQNGGAP